MATREASIRLTLNSSAFETQMRSLKAGMAGAGRAMGAAMSGPMDAGMRAAKASLVGTIGQIKSLATNVLMFGGALSAVGLVKSAIEMQSVYRRIAFDVSKIHGEAYDWQKIQQLIAVNASGTGQKTSAMAESFHQLWKATGNLDRSLGSLRAIGTISTASQIPVEQLTKAAEILIHKFDISSEKMPDALTKLVQMTGVGGKALEELGPRFGVLAGEAGAVGAGGTKSMLDLLGVFKILDDKIGEVADRAIMPLFQKLKSGTAATKKLEKVGVKFTADMTMLEKIRAILASTAGRKIAAPLFAGPARIAFEELAKPFMTAMNEAKTHRIPEIKAVNVALQRYDEAVSAASVATWDYSLMQKKAAERKATDPAVQMDLALGKLKSALNKPEVIAAINKVAQLLPKLAEELAKFLAFIVENPKTGAAMLVGGKAGAAGLGAAAGVMGASLLKGATMLGGKAVAGAGAGAAAIGATPIGSLPVGAYAGAGASIATTAFAALAVATAGAVGAGIGWAAFKAAVEPAIEERLKGLRSIDELLLTAAEVRGRRAPNREELTASIDELRAKQKAGAGGPGGFQSYLSHAAQFYGADIDSAEKQHADAMAKLATAEMNLVHQLEVLDRAAASAGKGLERTAEAAPKPGTSRGVRPPANSAPGAEPARG